MLTSALGPQIHSNPEIAFKERLACETMSTFLRSLKPEIKNLSVETGAYGLATSFEARYQSSVPGGRCVNFNAEYDALPGIGHACGHNLIGLASLIGFVALTSAIEKFDVAGSAQLLGTPAEEDGGGKVKLLEAGAYRSCDVSLMA